MIEGSPFPYRAPLGDLPDGPPLPEPREDDPEMRALHRASGHPRSMVQSELGYFICDCGAIWLKGIADTYSDTIPHD